MMNFLSFLPFALAEMSAVVVFLLHQKRNKDRIRQLILGGLCLGCVTACILSLPLVSTHTIYYALFHFFIIFILVCLSGIQNNKERILFTSLMEGSTHFLEHMIGDIFLVATGIMPFREQGFLTVKFISSVVIFIVYSAALYLIGYFIKKNKENQVPVYFWNVMTGLYCVLVVLDVICVRLITTGDMIPSQISSFIIFECIWYVLFLMTYIFVVNTDRYYRQRQDVAMMQTLIDKQQKQLELRKENVDQTAHLYHDMRKHLNVVKQMKNTTERAEYIKALEEELQSLDINCDTGNDTLDIIAADYMQRCRSMSIRLVLMVDGHLIDFMAMTDISALFTNALDNAIEAVQALPNEYDREIIVRMNTVKDWLIICFENKYKHILNIENDHILTTKDDSAMHGFGLRSIQMVCDKYNGELTCSTENERFILTCAFPYTDKNE